MAALASISGPHVVGILTGQRGAVVAIDAIGRNSRMIEIGR